MRRNHLDDIMEAVLENRRLLAHPFYRRWEAGELADGELRAYAAEYRHFEKLVPEVLEGISAQVGDAEVKASVVANLTDELGVPAAHLALFDQFAAALEAPVHETPSPAMKALVECYQSAVSEGPFQGLAVLAAYEIQSSDIAKSKGDGLRVHYGLNAQGTEFWDVHGAMDEDHADWTCDALARLAVDEEAEAVVTEALRTAADAWWEFLDEREHMAGVLAA